MMASRHYFLQHTVFTISSGTKLVCVNSVAAADEDLHCLILIQQFHTSAGSKMD